MNLRNTLLSVSALTLLSRVAGFFRDWLVAHAFGAGASTDAFFVAFRLPNLLRRLFAEGAFSQAFVPMLVAEKALGPSHYRPFINKVLTVLLIMVGVVTVVGIIFAPMLVRLTAPGFVDNPEKFALTVFLTRWCFPYIILVSALTLLSAILQCEKRFTAPALAPLFLNLSMIGFVLFSLPYWQNPIHALGYAALLGGLLQLVGPIIVLYRHNLLPRLDFQVMTAPVITMFKNMLPAILGVASGQINLLLNTVFASFLVSGAVSWLYYADRMMELPVGLLGAALGTIILPSLSQAVHDKAKGRVSALVDWGLRLSLLVSLPAALGFFICGPALLLTLFRYGAFGPNDALQSGYALSAYAIGLLPLIAQKVLAPVFYAKKNLKTPAWIGVGALVINQLQNLIWVKFFGHAGLALSISLTAMIQMGVLYALLYRAGDIRPLAGSALFIGKLLLALILLAIFLVMAMPTWEIWLSVSAPTRFIYLLGLIFGGAVVYGGAWWLMGLRPKDFSIQG